MWESVDMSVSGWRKQWVWGSVDKKFNRYRTEYINRQREREREGDSRIILCHSIGNLVRLTGQLS